MSLRTNRLSILAVAALASLPLTARAEGPIVVHLDTAKIVELPENVSTIIIGNPIVLDATILRGGQKMVLTGKSFGETNLIALDQSGVAISETRIKVTTLQGVNLTLQRGFERESWHCSPRCEPTAALGDTARHMSETLGQAATRNGASTAAPR
jgi:hypothetical protein